MKIKIISGGQTGVDRAALDAAMKLKLPCGGYAPKGRIAEDGAIPEKYPLKECDSADYSVRTGLNVVFSDATLIINAGELDGGTLYTYEIAEKKRKPVKIVDIDVLGAKKACAEILKFIKETNPLILNVAGPRESKRPGIYGKAFKILCDVFRDPAKR
ncbi:MAG: putative molybdenum carrier protein [Elusimicrobia bacterium]|nr:putative molybdenum carrier protein [Elusimicrobiota bacterium]